MRPRIPGSTASILAGLWMLIGLVVVPTDAAETFSLARVAAGGSRVVRHRAGEGQREWSGAWE